MSQLQVLTKAKSKHMTDSRQFQGIPGIEITQQGRLWATWYSGGDGEGKDNFVVLVTSINQGKSWSDPVAVVDPPGGERAFDPTLWISPDGVLHWFWAQCVPAAKGCISDGTDGVWMAECSDMESDCPDWSTPRRITNGIMMNKPIVLSNGDWALPTALWTKNIGGATSPKELQHECYSNVLISPDEGNNFNLRIGPDIPERCFDEHCLVELKDGRLWNLVRTNYGIGESFSVDQGKTWTPGKNSDIPGPNSRFFIRRLNSGNLIMVNHVVDEKKPQNRKDLTAWISKDDGKTWEGGLLLDERNGISYPDGCQDKNGNIWIIYDHARYVEGDILIAKFTENDVIEKKIVSPESKLNIMVNHSGGLK